MRIEACVLLLRLFGAANARCFRMHLHVELIPLTMMAPRVRGTISRFAAHGVKARKFRSGSGSNRAQRVAGK